MITVLMMKENEIEEVKAFLNKKVLDKLCMLLRDGEKLLAVGEFEASFDSATLVSLKGNEEFFYALSKAILNIVDLNGIKTVYASESISSELKKKLRFTEEESKSVLDLNGYFTGGC